jgi:hypothetical protein
MMGIPVKIFMIAFQFKISHYSEHIDPPLGLFLFKTDKDYCTNQTGASNVVNKGANGSAPFQTYG